MTAGGPLVALAREILEIPSETGREKDLCDFLEARLRAAGVEVLRCGDSLMAVPAPPDPERATVALLGHLDTVPSHGEAPVRLEGDRLFGTGASDMKGAVALMVLLAEEAAARHARTNVLVVLYAGEEGPFEASGLPAVLEAGREHFAPTKLALCMEPTANRLELGCVGSFHARVSFRGRRAHSARPWEGENAIHRAAGFLGRLASRPAREVAVEGLRFREVMTATMVSFRGARNVVPDLFTLNVNCRFAPGTDPGSVQRELEEMAAGEAEVSVGDLCPAGAVPTRNPLLAELEEAAGGLQRRAKQAWTDVGRLSAMGFDAANFGPGRPEQAHQAGEWVALSDLGRCREVMRRWLWR